MQCVKDLKKRGVDTPSKKTKGASHPWISRNTKGVSTRAKNKSKKIYIFSLDHRFRFLLQPNQQFIPKTMTNVTTKGSTFLRTRKGRQSSCKSKSSRNPPDCWNPPDSLLVTLTKSRFSVRIQYAMKAKLSEKDPWLLGLSPLFKDYGISSVTKIRAAVYSSVPSQDGIWSSYWLGHCVCS